MLSSVYPILHYHHCILFYAFVSTSIRIYKHTYRHIYTYLCRVTCKIQYETLIQASYQRVLNGGNGMEAMELRQMRISPYKQLISLKVNIVMSEKAVFSTQQIKVEPSCSIEMVTKTQNVTKTTSLQNSSLQNSSLQQFLNMSFTCIVRKYHFGKSLNLNKD